MSLRFCSDKQFSTAVKTNKSTAGASPVGGIKLQKTHSPLQDRTEPPPGASAGSGECDL